MNRRNFIASLIALPVGLLAAAKACAKPPGLDLDAIFDDLYKIRRNRQLTSNWMQTTRMTRCSSIAYDDALDEAFGLPEPERRKNWHERRKERARYEIAKLKTQRPLPLP